MYHTPPPTRIETRKAKARREQEEKKLLENATMSQNTDKGHPSQVHNSTSKLQNLIPHATTSVPKILINTNKDVGSVQSEPTAHGVKKKMALITNVTKSLSSRGSKGSSASREAMKKQLVLDAARQKAAIQMEIIDKTLDAQLAALCDEEYQEYSSQTDRSDYSRRDVAQWVDQQSNHREPQVDQQVLDNGTLKGELNVFVPASSVLEPGPAPRPATPAPDAAPVSAAPLPPADGTVTALNSAIQVLAEAVKGISIANANNAPGTSLLSRLSTPKDLPEFAGDYFEWLQFKQAYYESTEICRFTDKENLWRLRKCLRGPAKDAVNALFISATSPDKVMSALELRYGNPDCIISRVLNDIKKLQPLHNEYHKDIVTFSLKVQNYIEAVRAVGQEEHLQGLNVVSIILSKLPTVLISKWTDYSFNLIKEGLKPRLLIMSDFLNDEAVKTSTTASIYSVPKYDGYKPKSSDYNSNTRSQHTVLVQSEGSDKKCKFCRTSIHKLTECKPFKRALRKVRWQFVRKNGLCYKCLLSTHNREACRAPACDRDGCGEAHHRLLHYTVTKAGASRTTSDTCLTDSASCSTECFPERQEAESNNVPETLTHINASDRKVLLKVVPVRVQGPNGIVSCTALLDDGSSVSLISAKLARQVGLCGRTETLRVRGAFADNEIVCESEVVNVDLKGMDNKFHKIKMRCVDELCLPLQSLSVLKLVNYSHLADIKHNLCTIDSKPDLLIGQDNHYLLLPIEFRVGNANEPSASLSPLGWAVHGKVCVPRTVCQSKHYSSTDVHTNLFISETATYDESPSNESLLKEIHEDVRRSFLIDSMGVSASPRQNADDVRAVAQLERSARLVEGRWHVGLPWRDEHCTMPDSYPSALNRMKGIERKMTKDSGFAERYRERINHLLQNDYAMELPDSQIKPKTWYLAHFGVDNPNKKRLRLVFDAANKVNNLCLNDYLLTGPDLLSSLLGIMLRFRENKVGVTGDIKDMFLRVKIREEDQHALRFLWRDDPAGELKTYLMTSLIFGANCSPFVAQFVKNLNARRYESSMPDAVNAIYNSHYVDDYIDSFPDDASAIEMVKNIRSIHSAGGFEIRNFTSNSVAVLNSVPKETLGTAAVRFKVGQQHDGERTLGLIWFQADDVLGFDVSLKRIPESIINGQERPTKRLMLKVIMSIFDVLGFLAPFTIQGRIMLQATWRSQIGWDDQIPNEIYDKWLKWIDLLKVISNIRIPRCYSAVVVRKGSADAQLEGASASEMQESDVGHWPRPLFPAPPPHAAGAPTELPTNYDGVAASTSATTGSIYNNLQVHFFCDASTQAMSTVGYWRWIDNGVVYVAFIASKSRVMPVKPLTIPKAELQAALLAARLANTIKKEHKLTPIRRYFWCDSTTVLQWIRNNTRTYKAFEANRLGEIDEHTRVDEWRYVPTNQNVADLATRDSFDLNLQGEWFTGPSFLYSDESSWPKDVVSDGNYYESSECVAAVHTENELACPPVPDPQRFSSWLRLTRATAAVLKFIARCKGQRGDIDCGMMERAEILLLRHAQLESFGDDLSRLNNRLGLHRSSRLVKLTPIIDENGLLRVGGRIDAAVGIAPDVKRPVILDGRHPISRLIVRHYHIKVAHGNQETVVNEIKQRYWMLRLRPTVKFVTSQCMLCRILKSKPAVPRMGDLPEARVAHHQRPFYYCGLDLFGPMEVTVGRRREKRYGVLFTCLTVRAVHIELVASLTTDSLIMALRRMAARRAWPRHLFSDNGTNLRGSDTELQRSMQALDTDVLKAEGVSNDMDWTFSPPASPHWGGAWERLIRSIKSALKVTLKERAPRDEVLSTLMAEIENMVNSRPLMHVSVDPSDSESLTPNHFLLGSSSRLPIIGEFDDADLSLRKQWRQAQRLADMYWQRWVREILPDLLPRTKWQEERKPLQVGDLVLVVDPNSPRNIWPKGLITQVFPGRDGRIRVVEVRTATGKLRRSAARIAPIPVSVEC